MSHPTHRILLTCPDQPGLVAAVAGHLAAAGANILDADQHSDSGHFALRLEFDLDPAAEAGLQAGFQEHVAGPLDMTWKLRWSHQPPPRVAVLCSREDHCMLDLLWRSRSGELPGDITQVVSTFDHHRTTVEAAGAAFHHEPVAAGADGIQAHEQALLERLKGRVDLVVLARYMRVLSSDFLNRVGCPAINIHHSFLPAFPGAGPYQRAYERGVKLIGASAHYVTADLDDGPLIEQDVQRVTHRHDPDDLRRLGADIERLVLARAVRAHLEDRVALFGRRTVVFS